MHKRMLIISVTGISILCCIVAGVYLLQYSDHKTLPKRLTSELQNHVTNKEPFQHAKLIQYQESGPINLNGDSEMSGVYQLPVADVKKIMSLSHPLTCPKHNCKFTTQGFDSHDYFADEPGNKSYRLAVDSANNQVTWTVSWY